MLMLQVLECYALNEPPPEDVNDGTKPDDEGMQKNMEAIIGFRVSRSSTHALYYASSCALYYSVTVVHITHLLYVPPR